MGYFASQVGKTVPEHAHDYVAVAVVRDRAFRPGIAKAATAAVCRVCGARKES